MAILLANVQENLAHLHSRVKDLKGEKGREEDCRTVAKYDTA